MFVRGTELDQFGTLDVILTVAPGASNKKSYLRARYFSCGKYRFTFIKPTAPAIAEIRRRGSRFDPFFALISFLISYISQTYLRTFHGMLVALFLYKIYI